MADKGASDNIEQSIKNLSDNNPDIRKRAAIFLTFCIWENIDVTPALASLEKASFDEDDEVKEHAAAALETYALLMYKVDITYPRAHSIKAIGKPLENSSHLVSIRDFNAGPGTSVDASGKNSGAREKPETVRSPYESGRKVIPLSVLPTKKLIERSLRVREETPAENRIFPAAKIEKCSIETPPFFLSYALASACKTCYNYYYTKEGTVPAYGEEVSEAAIQDGVMHAMIGITGKSSLSARVCGPLPSLPDARLPDSGRSLRPSEEVPATALVPEASVFPVAQKERVYLIPYVPRAQISYSQRGEAWKSIPLVRRSDEYCPPKPMALAPVPPIIKGIRKIVPYIPYEPTYSVREVDRGTPFLENILDKEVYAVGEDYSRLSRTEGFKRSLLSLMMLTIICAYILSHNEVPTSSAGMSGIDGRVRFVSLGDNKRRNTEVSTEDAVNGALPLQYEGTLVIEKPTYLTRVDRHRQRYIDAEFAVFEALTDVIRGKKKYIEWFNALTEEQKRGFILFIRSHALSRFLGNMVRFNRDQWMSGVSKKIKYLSEEYLMTNDFMDIADQYEATYGLAEARRALFLSNNTWLLSFLRKNYADFEKGLFYFFAEHQFGKAEILRMSYQFSKLQEKIIRVSEAIIADKGNHTRISPKKGVENEQIKEIVAGAFFAELFYRVPADFIVLISAYESNFSMEYWEGGYGTTQQTIRAANTVLYSEFWIDRMKESAGVRVRMQMVPISALDNVFLCIAEAAKTIAIKAAELKIETDEIGPAKKVRFGGKTVPATWITAYKYNGSKKNALEYARAVHRFYKKRGRWLKSFDDTRSLLPASL